MRRVVTSLASTLLLSALAACSLGGGNQLAGSSSGSTRASTEGTLPRAAESTNAAVADHEPSESGGDGAVSPPPGSRPTPAATTSGDITQDDMPQKIGPFALSKAVPFENEFQGNGTPVWQPDLATVASSAIPLCGVDAGAPPAVDEALAAYYTDGHGATGHALILQFGSERDAQTWFGVFESAVRECRGAAYQSSLVDGARALTGSRSVEGAPWSEALLQAGDTVRVGGVPGDLDPLLILADLA